MVLWKSTHLIGMKVGSFRVLKLRRKPTQGTLLCVLFPWQGVSSGALYVGLESTILVTSLSAGSPFVVVVSMVRLLMVKFS